MLEDIIKDRLKKLKEYEGFNDPYPSSVKRTMCVAEAVRDFSKLIKSRKKTHLVGRLMSLRDQGKIVFADLKDESGKIQIVFRSKETKDFDRIVKLLDVGDFLEAEGKFFLTKKKEKSLLVSKFRIISKSILPIPREWFGIVDPETRLRKRYLDLILNDETKEVFVKKNVFWDEIRRFLKKKDFLEVETPVLESVPGGAEAEPFITYHNALDDNFYLRISLELPLKKLLVGGYEKVFEIGRIFRNEGISREHLQDYTQMECYWAYADYEDMMKLVEEMYKSVIKKTTGSLKTKFGNQTLDWGKKWQRIDYYKVFENETGLNLKKVFKEQLLKKAKEIGLKPEGHLGRGKLIDLIYKKSVRPKLIQPSFLINPPVDIEPLAKRLEEDKDRVARFQVVAAGSELGKGFSELNNPLDQRGRFEEQMELRKKGDKEAHQINEDFLEAMEYGMPPAAGFGLSERLFAVLMDKPVREMVVFPLMRKGK